MFPADPAGEKQCLIISSLAQALGMKRYGHNPIEFPERELGILIARQEFSERLGQVTRTPIFEAGNGFQEQPLIEADGSSPGKKTVLSKAFPAKMVVSYGRPKAQTAAGASGVGKNFELFQASGAGQVHEVFELRLATERT